MRRDESRPCAGCRKKGLTAEQCVYGCEACRRALARCEGGAPCLRCVSMHLNCAHGAILPLTTLQSRGKSDKRAKLACKNCRRDNKKVSSQRTNANEGRAPSLTDALHSQCEDQRPCKRCVLRGDECIHVARGPKLVKVRCQPCRETNRRCEDARPCQSCSTHGEMCINPPKKGRVNGTRVKVACVKCRQDKVRCDGQRPCASCGRKGIVCQDRDTSSRRHHGRSGAVEPPRFSPDGTQTHLPGLA
ncbi:hypothetical protein BJV78DRAFT_580019 [Lactifluus subvellereus]|nr:hypothetical protein BJV78DRAFT_580019 [Lactifluus subvellereus]